MHALRRNLTSICGGLALFLPLGGAAAADGDWRNWGGPNHDFTVPAAPLAEKWPDGGPRQLWSLDLEGGYASIPVADGVAYIVARDGNDELVLAVDAATGAKKWEYRYAAPIPAEPEKAGYDTRFGFAPHSTPLVLDDRVITIGHFSHMNCLDKQGKLLWSHDLRKDFPGSMMHFGYSASPVRYKNTVITLVGGKEHALVAFNPADGKVVWHKHDYDVSYGSPQITQIGGRDVLLTQVLDNMIACNPDNGELYWSAPRVYQYHHNAASPLVCGDGAAFFGTPDSGQTSALLKFKWDGDKLTADPVWTSRFGQVHQNALAFGEQILSSSGRPGAAVLIDAKTGEFKWRDREVGQCNFVKVGDQLVALEENGTLHLCKIGSEGLEIAASADLLGERSWAPPTLVGTKLYIRDPKKVLALDLGAAMAAGH